MKQIWQHSPFKDNYWFVPASSLSIGQLFGCLAGGYLGERIGPKRTIMLSGFLAIMGWISIASAHHLGLLITGRVVCGFCSSMCSANCSLLVAQYSSTQRRGGFLALYMLMSGIGVLICYSLGAGLHWRYVALFPTLLYSCMIIGLLIVPESPLWLLTHRTEEDAVKALHWLRASDEVSEEMSVLNQSRENKQQAMTAYQAISDLSRPDVWKPFLLILINFLFAMFAGPFIVIFYAVQIFQDAGITAVNAHLAAIAVEVCMVLGGILSIFFTQKVQRRSLAMMSMSTMSFSMAALGFFHYTPDLGSENLALRLLPILCIMLFMFSFGAGAGPLQWVFMGELLPPEYKVLSGILVSLSTIAIFITTKMFHTLVEVLQPYGVYWLLAGVSLLSNIFYATCMPETKGKSLLEIRKLFL